MKNQKAIAKSLAEGADALATGVRFDQLDPLSRSLLPNDIFPISAFPYGEGAGFYKVNMSQVLSYITTNYPPVNIYTADGTLGGNRIVTLPDNGSIEFSGLALTATDSIFTVKTGTFETDGYLTKLNTVETDIYSAQIGLKASQFLGVNEQFLTVNEDGYIVPVVAPTGLNIYNSNGVLTSDRTVFLDSLSLEFTGSAGSSVQFSVPDFTVNGAQAVISSSNIKFDAVQFTGEGTQWLTTDNDGNIVPLGEPHNIYNANGFLTADRTVTVGARDLTFTGNQSGASISTVNFNIGNFAITGNNTLLASGGTYISGADIRLTNAIFAGHGNSLIGVNNLGQLQLMSESGDINIYNTSGTLTENRSVDLNNNSLTFTGALGDMLSFSQDQGNVSVTSVQFNVTSPTIIFESLDGPGDQYVTVDNLGRLGRGDAPADTNIYNTSGALSGDRAVTMGSNILLFSGNTSGSLSNFQVTSGIITLDGTTAVISTTNLNISTAAVSLLASQFVGGGEQYLTVNDDGLIVPAAGTSSVNIYNSNGSLGGNRVVTLGSNTLSFSGTGGVNIGSNCTATASCSFAQGNTNNATAVNSAIIGGLLNNNAGIGSGIFASNGSTINAGSGTTGYAAILACYNTVGTDNQGSSLSAFNGVNNGHRSLLFGGQNNKINAPNTVLTEDCIITQGDTNTITGNVKLSSIWQSNSCIIGDNTNAISAALIVNGSGCTASPGLGQSNIVDINGTNNTVRSHYSFLINCTSNNFISSVSGLAGRFFLANAVSFSVPAGSYLGALNSQAGTLNGNYSTMLSCNTSSLGSTASYSTIVSGINNANQGQGCAIFNGNGSTVGNVTNSGSIGSACTVYHSNCLAVNSGALALASQNADTLIFKGANGIGIGQGVDNPNRDVMLGRKLSLYSVTTSVSVSTAGVPAILYFMSAAANNLNLTLSSSDNVPGNTFRLVKTGANGSYVLTVTPTSGQINGASSFVSSGTALGAWWIQFDGTNWHCYP